MTIRSVIQSPGKTPTFVAGTRFYLEGPPHHKQRNALRRAPARARRSAVKEAPFSLEIPISSPAETAAWARGLPRFWSPAMRSRWKAISAPARRRWRGRSSWRSASMKTVPSPTFTLVQRYETPRLAVAPLRSLSHRSARRRSTELGLDEALAEGAALIEWPERAGARLPADALHVQLAIVDETSRRARISGPATLGEAFRGAGLNSEREEAMRRVP